MPIELLDTNENRFLDDLTSYYHTKGPNHEARALFNCIQAAFTKNGYTGHTEWESMVIAHPEMISHLAACATVALEYDRKSVIPWDRGDHDYILTRTIRYFMTTLRNAIQKGRFNEVDGKILHGCFKIPRWFYDTCFVEA